MGTIDTINKYSEIINGDPADLYNKAIQFYGQNDLDNHIIHMVMAANLNCQDAIRYLETFNDRTKIYHYTDNTTEFFTHTQNYAWSAAILAYTYKYGIKCPVNMDKSIELYKMAINKNCALAMNNLGSIYDDAGNYDDAAKMYRMAIQLNNPYAMRNLVRLKLHNGYDACTYIEAEHLCKLSYEIDKSNSAFSLLVGLYNSCKECYIIEDIIEYIMDRDPAAIELLFNKTTIEMALKINQHKKDLQAARDKIHEQDELIKRLTTHINLAPGGAEYMELLKEWDHKINGMGMQLKN